MPEFAVIEAPSVLGLKPTGVEDLPMALLDAGLGRALGARHAGRVVPPAYDPRRDATTGILNTNGIASYSVRLADRVGSVLEANEFPVILGGDCSIILGSLLALRRLGRYGLLFIDGHADFYQPDADPAGEAASMDLALATGRGPNVITDIEGRAPLVRDDDVVLYGYRDGEEQLTYGSQPIPPTLLALDLESIRRLGARRAAHRAIARLTRSGGPAGFFVHLDVDVLDDALMPAVDYRLPGGLTWTELGTTLDVALATGSVVGLEVTIYNPTLDENGDCGRRLSSFLVDALRILRRP